jgi:hypothetical protein
MASELTGYEPSEQEKDEILAADKLYRNEQVSVGL